MKCPVCGHDNPPGARFCANCGTSLWASQAPEPERNLIGQLVGGRYLITRVIGEGGMGVVYEAEQRMGSEVRRVAVKTLLPALSKDPVIVSRFYRECGIVSQLDHPNTIKFYDFGETPDGALYISMEYVRGQALTELIERGALPLDRTRHILRQVCGALYEAHSMGIIHRDLKPDNIVLTDRTGEPDFVKLLDFGIAARTGPASSETKLTQQGTVLGTPPYMSPEQLTGEHIDARSDIYSLGVIAYEMLTGHLPFDADTPWQWAQKHMFAAPPPMRDRHGQPVVPPEVERAVFHALAKKPDDRPGSALDFYSELSIEARSSASPGVNRTPEKVHTLDDLPADRTSPMPMVPPMVPSAVIPASALQAPPVPDFAYQRTAMAPEVHGPIGTSPALAAPVPPPARPRRRGLSLGMVAAAIGGLAAIGGATAAIVYFSQSSTPSPEPTPVPSTTASTVEIAPLVTAPTAPATTAAPPAPEPEPPRKTPTTPTRTTPKTPTRPTTTPLPPAPTVTQQPQPTPEPQPQPTPQPQPQPQPTPQPQPQPQPTPTPEPPSGSGGDQACFQSRDAANAGNIEAAASLLRRCQQTGGSSSAQIAARQRLRSQVGPAIQRRANLGDCAGARSAAAAAASVGVMDGAGALARTSCGG